MNYYKIFAGYFFGVLAMFLMYDVGILRKLMIAILMMISTLFSFNGMRENDKK